MRKIIDGRKYDTETATKLAEIKRDQGDSLRFYEEALYRKRTGEYFMYGHGGGMSRYSRYVPEAGMSGPGEAITPVSADQAREWASKELSTDGYEEIFGEVSEGEPVEEGASAVMAVRVSPATRERLRRLAWGSDSTQGAVLDGIVADAASRRDAVERHSRVKMPRPAVVIERAGDLCLYPAHVKVEAGGITVVSDDLRQGDSVRLARALMALGADLGSRRDLLRLLLTIELRGIGVESRDRREAAEETLARVDYMVEGVMTDAEVERRLAEAGLPAQG